MSRPGGLPSVNSAQPVAGAQSQGLSTALAGLVEADSTRSALPPTSRSLDLDQVDRVQVYVEAEPTTEAEAVIAASGGVVERIASGIVQAWVPVDALTSIGALPSVRIVREPERPLRNSGSVTTEGDLIHAANTLRSTYGSDGTGVKVGVLSDGLAGLAAAQATGDLPDVNSTTCDVIETAPPGAPDDPTDAGAGSEGVAMLEIVHDIAPGAELWFGYFGFSFATTLDFNAAVDCLADHVDVVIDDIAFLNAGAYDGTSIVSQNTTSEAANVANPIRGYFNAAGNYALSHYQENFANSGFLVGTPSRQVHEWSATAGTTDADFGLFCSGLPADGFCSDVVVLQPGGNVRVALQWNDVWGASGNDYDLFVIDATLPSPPLVTASAIVQDGNDNPAEFFTWTNITGADQVLAILIGKRTGAARTLDYFSVCSGCYFLGAPLTLHSFNTVASSVANNSDAADPVVSLGAIDAQDPGNDTIERFSSHGPTNDGRLKPNASAIDGVTVTGSGGFGSPFFGTSAAAPHAGAIAALLLSCNASLLAVNGGNATAERTALRNALLNSAIDLGTAGTDQIFGTGRLSATAAATAAGCTTDADADTVLNAADNCPTIANASQTNTDAAPLVTTGLPNDNTVPTADGVGDACDLDDDNDGLADADEPAGCNGSGALNPLAGDTDGDRSRDFAECLLGSNPGDALSKPNTNPPADADNDAIPDAVEATIGSNPNAIDTDGDGMNDNVEFRGYSSNLTAANSDGDGCTDDVEIPSINLDTVVNVLDLSLAAGSFGSTVRPNHDVNKDGVVNILDLSLQAGQFTTQPC
jgi:hypothetical protein